MVFELVVLLKPRMSKERKDGSKQVHVRSMYDRWSTRTGLSTQSKSSISNQLTQNTNAKTANRTS